MKCLKICVYPLSLHTGTRDVNDKSSFPFNTSAPPATFLSTVTMTTVSKPMAPAVAYRDPCDPSFVNTSSTTTTAVPLSLPPPPPSASRASPSMQYPSQQQASMHGSVLTKSTTHVSSQTTSTPVTSRPKLHSRLANHSAGKRTAGFTAAKVKPLSTQERMSLFMEHSVATSSRPTPKIVIRKDAKFKSACNKMRWLDKHSGAATLKAITSSADEYKDSVAAASDNREKVTEENNTQFYSFHEKADPSLDESVNPPIKLPSALLVSSDGYCFLIT